MGVHQLGEFPFDFLSALGVAQQQSVPGGLGSLLGTADHPGEKGIGDGRHQNHQIAGSARAKLHRHQVRSITGLFHGGVDLVPSVGEHALRRLQCSGYCGHRDAGKPGYFTDIGQDHLIIELCGWRA
ncbi:hypothetical protein D3C75_1113830 [compost metagenome]